jgi:hypothetical protein
MTQVMECALIRTGQEAVLSSDGQSWVLYRLKRGDTTLLDAPIPAQKLRPLAFCRTKAALQREIREEGLILTAQGASIVEALSPRYL